MAPESDSFWSGDVIFHFTKGKGIISKIVASKTKAFIFSPTAYSIASLMSNRHTKCIIVEGSALFFETSELLRREQ